MALIPASDASASCSVDTLYRDHHRWLHRWLSLRLGPAGDAVDLVHDTYVRILASGRMPAAGRERAFLMQTAKGLVIDLHRRRELESAYLEALAAQGDSYAPSEEQRAIVLETLLHIDRILSGLPRKAAWAFLLSQIDGLGYAEIAARLDVSVSSVTKYIAQALQACYQATYD